MEWKDITTGQFLDLYKLATDKGLDELEKSSQAIGIIYDKTPRQVEEMTMGEFSAKSKEAGKFLTSNIPGKPVRFTQGKKGKYRIIYDPAKLRQRQYVEILHFGEKPIENMHLVMASLVRPVRWGTARKNTVKEHMAISEDLLTAPVTDIYHACVFFCSLYKNLMNSTRDYLVSEMMTTGMTREKANEMLTASINAMDGFTTQPVSLNTNG